MKTSFPLGRIDSIDLSTAGVLVASLLLQSVYGDYTETWSELLCWSIVLVAVEAQSWVHAGGGYTALDPSVTKWHSTVIAGGIALGSFCRSVEDVRWLVVCFTLHVSIFPSHVLRSSSLWSLRFYSPSGYTVRSNFQPRASNRTRHWLIAIRYGFKRLSRWLLC